MQGMMKQMQKMQKDMQKTQENLGNIEVEGSAGGGMVKVIANCNNQIVKIDVDPEVIDKDEKDPLKIWDKYEK